MDHFNCEMRKAPWGRIAALFCLTVALAGCDRSKTADSSARSYQVRGIVRAFAPDRSTVSIEHENIPGFMPSMTMPFSVKDQKDIASLKIGDAISFRMTVTDKDLFLDQVKKIPASEVHVAEPTPTGSASPQSQRVCAKATSFRPSPWQIKMGRASRWTPFAASHLC